MTVTNSTHVLVAIPCYNTEKHVARVVAGAKKHARTVVVIDDGSIDSTAEQAKLSGAEVFTHVSNTGYGGALKSCFRVANCFKPDILVIIDGDGQHEPEEIPRLLDSITGKKADLVIGSRFLMNANFVPGYRVFGIRVINFLWNFGAKEKVTDSQSGFRAYAKNVYENMIVNERGMSASIEILERVRKNRFKIEEVPITCNYNQQNSRVVFSSIKQGLSVAVNLVRIRILSFFWH